MEQTPTTVYRYNKLILALPASCAMHNTDTPQTKWAKAQMKRCFGTFRQSHWNFRHTQITKTTSFENQKQGSFIPWTGINGQTHQQWFSSFHWNVFLSIHLFYWWKPRQRSVPPKVQASRDGSFHLARPSEHQPEASSAGQTFLEKNKTLSARKRLTMFVPGGFMRGQLCDCL